MLCYIGMTGWGPVRGTSEDTTWYTVELLQRLLRGVRLRLHASAGRWEAPGRSFPASLDCSRSCTLQLPMPAARRRLLVLVHGVAHPGRGRCGRIVRMDGASVGWSARRPCWPHASTQSLLLGLGVRRQQRCAMQHTCSATRRARNRCQSPRVPPSRACAAQQGWRSELVPPTHTAMRPACNVHMAAMQSTITPRLSAPAPPCGCAWRLGGSRPAPAARRQTWQGAPVRFTCMQRRTPVASFAQTPPDFCVLAPTAATEQSHAGRLHASRCMGGPPPPCLPCACRARSWPPPSGP